MLSEERQKANERLALLCGWTQIQTFHNVTCGIIPDTSTERCGELLPIPYFYADTPDAAYWRERARLALYEKTGIRAVWRETKGSDFFTCFFTPNDMTDASEQGDHLSYIEAHNAAILAALDALEKEGLGIPDEGTKP